MENGSVNNVLSTNNQSITNYNSDFIFLRDNKYSQGDYTNDTYVDETLAAGTLMGRVTATGVLVVLKSASSDGSQIPVGILTRATDVAAGETVTVNICDGGEVAQELVVLDGTDTLETIIDSRRLKDRIGADTVGIVLVLGTELSEFDNQ